MEFCLVLQPEPAKHRWEQLCAPANVLGEAQGHHAECVKTSTVHTAVPMTFSASWDLYNSSGPTQTAFVPWPVWWSMGQQQPPPESDPLPDPLPAPPVPELWDMPWRAAMSVRYRAKRGHHDAHRLERQQDCTPGWSSVYCNRGTLLSVTDGQLYLVVAMPDPSLGDADVHIKCKWWSPGCTKVLIITIGTAVDNHQQRQHDVRMAYMKPPPANIWMSLKFW